MVLNNRSYTLTILVALSAFNQLDRQLTSVLLEPIRHEFALSDVQLGLLSGPAFMVLFAGMSIPAAIWAVHASRRNLIAVAAAFWGGMTFLSGLAHSYWALIVGRIGVGLGEAGAMPASHALISDLYKPHERGGAMAAWSSGVNIGVFLAFLLGGMIGQMFGWRAGCSMRPMSTCILSAASGCAETRPNSKPKLHANACARCQHIVLNAPCSGHWSPRQVRRLVPFL